MNKEKIVWLKINSSSYYNILVKLNDIGITLYDNKKEKDYILIKTKYSDYKKIKKYLVSYNTTIYDETGLDKLKNILKKYQVFTIGIILSIFILFLANNIIFKIEVKSANKNIRNLILEQLKENGLKTLSLKKSHKQIEVIVNKILDNNKDTLEWLEIKYDGLIMIVNVTEKTPTKNELEYAHCDIVASTDAKISSLNIYRGVALKEINDYVLKGEVILSGDILYNEEVKNTVCASGEVYGDVWYKVSVTVPLNETYTYYTGKNRYNLNVVFNENKYKIFKSRIDKSKEEEINLYKLNDFEINLVKEKEYIEKTRELTETEAYTKGVKLAEEKVKLTLDKDEKILLKKVLKNEANDSTIYLEIFIVTKENIGKLKVVEEEIPNGVESNNESVQ